MYSSRAYFISETCPRQDWIPESITLYCISQGRIQDFKLEGGGALKKIAPSGGRRENFRGITCEKSRFYAKKSFFPIAEGSANIFGVFRVKNHDFTPNKIIFSPILGGGARAPGAPPAGSAPVITYIIEESKLISENMSPNVIHC